MRNSYFIIFLLLFCFTHAQKLVHTYYGHGAAVSKLAISYDDKYLVSGSKDETVRIWDLNKDSVLKVIKSPDGSISALHFFNQSYDFAIGCYKQINFWNAATTKKKGGKKKIHTSFVSAIAINADGSLIATSSWRDNTLRFFDLNHFSLKSKALSTELAWIDASTFFNKSNLLVTGDHENYIKLWDVNTGSLISKIAAHDDWIYGIVVSPDDQFIYSVALDNTVKVFDTKTLKLIETLKGHSGGIAAISISKDGKYLATGDLNNTIIVWDLKNYQPLFNFKAHEEMILSIQFDNAGKYLYSASKDKTIKKWQLF